MISISIFRSVMVMVLWVSFDVAVAAAAAVGVLEVVEVVEVVAFVPGYGED